jgi:hypothetical protein
VRSLIADDAVTVGHAYGSEPRSSR